MIVALDELKRVLGIASEDASQDQTLIELMGRALVWVEGEVHRRFDEPEIFVEVKQGSGRRGLFLTGHIDPAVIEDESAGELAVVRVRERFIGDDATGWTELEENTDYERRGDVLYRFGGWAIWNRGMEYELTYPNGYTDAPKDIQALIIEMVASAYGADASSADGTAGITSEKIGDYGYSLGSASSGTAGAAGGGSLSGTGNATLNRWRRKLV